MNQPSIHEDLHVRYNETWNLKPCIVCYFGLRNRKIHFKSLIEMHCRCSLNDLPRMINFSRAHKRKIHSTAKKALKIYFLPVCLLCHERDKEIWNDATQHSAVAACSHHSDSLNMFTHNTKHQQVLWQILESNFPYVFMQFDATCQLSHKCYVWQQQTPQERNSMKTHTCIN